MYKRQALANAPLGHVDDAPQPNFIGGIVDDAQVGNHVPDLFAVEEAGAADDAVGDALLGEHALQGLGLGVHPVEHGEVRELPALGHPVQNGLGDACLLYTSRCV